MPHYRVIQGSSPMNGELTGANFVDGICEGDLTFKQISIIGANYILERVLDDESSFQVSTIAIDPVATEFVQSVYAKERQLEADALVGEDQINAAIDGSNVDQSTLQGVAIYTREYLEAIADSKGMTGLREIADGHGVKSRSISDIIAALLSITG